MKFLCHRCWDFKEDEDPFKVLVPFTCGLLEARLGGLLLAEGRYNIYVK